MSTTSPLARLLESKAPLSSEIEVHLFERCNLRCAFCGQDHDDDTGLASIREKAKPILEFIRANPRRDHTINLMGGELFADDLPDEAFEAYADLATKVARGARELGHRCRFNWVTNFIFDRRDRVERLLAHLDEEGIPAFLATSYDLHGRQAGRWSIEVFRANLEAFAHRVHTVGFVLTKPTIRALLADGDAFFRELYARYDLYFDYYVPESGASALMPSDDEILSAYHFVAERYPRIQPVRDLLERERNAMTCYSLNKTTILPDGRQVKCRYLTYKPGDFRHEVDATSNENIIWGHLQENECLGCEFFGRCGFRCFVQADWSKRQRREECLFKDFFRRHPVRPAGSA